LQVTPGAKQIAVLRFFRWELCLAFIFAVFGLIVRHSWVEANAPLVALTFRDTQVELVSDTHNLCGADRTASSGEMSVPVDYFDVSTSGRVFQVTQFRHEICSVAGCPVRVFILNPDGSRGLLVNGVMPLVERGQRGNKAYNLLISRDGRTLTTSGASFALNWS
jgi:hypothetical protein